MTDVAIRVNNLSQLYRIEPLGETPPPTAVFPFGVRECCRGLAQTTICSSFCEQVQRCRDRGRRIAGHLHEFRTNSQTDVIVNREIRIAKFESGSESIRNSRFAIRNSRFPIRNPPFKIRNPPFKIPDSPMNLLAASREVSKTFMSICPKGVTPECVNRGSSPRFVWIPDRRIRE